MMSSGEVLDQIGGGGHVTEMPNAVLQVVGAREWGVGGVDV